MGISTSNHVVVYDRNKTFGLFSSPRVWWMFKVTLLLMWWCFYFVEQVFGHTNVSVLDGGLTYWKYCHHPVETGAPRSPCPQRYTASYHPLLVRDMVQVKDYLSSGSAQVH